MGLGGGGRIQNGCEALGHRDHIAFCREDGPTRKLNSEFDFNRNKRTLPCEMKSLTLFQKQAPKKHRSDHLEQKKKSLGDEAREQRAQESGTVE